METDKIDKRSKEYRDLIGRKPVAERAGGNPGIPRDAYDTTITDEILIAALDKTFGLIPEAAKLLGMSSTGLRKRLHNNPELEIACQKAREEIVLIAEKKMFDSVEAGDLKSVTFVLSRLGRHRGWGEESTVTLKSSINPEDAKREVAAIFSLAPSDVPEVTTGE